MRTVVPLDQIAERRRLGLDRFDEVWEGEYRMNAAPHPRHSFLLRHVLRLLDPIAEHRGLIPLGEFNLGRPDDFRIPDAGYVDGWTDTAFLPSARIVIEVLSPGDATPDKLPFYARHDVGELLVIDPAGRTAQWLLLDRVEARYVTAERSVLLDISAEDITRPLPWEHLHP
jgi:Uma2 family endonuclease